MKIHIIVIATEVLKGLISDANGPWIGETLLSHGLVVDKVSVLPDEESMLLNEISKSLDTYEATIITGGLGPTEDDLTKQIAAKACGKKVIFRQDAYDLSVKQYARIGKDFDPKRSDYDHAPEDFTIYPNDVGLAPGLHFETDKGNQIFCLPGVPRELKEMFKQNVLKQILSKCDEAMQEDLIFRTYKVPEEALFAGNLWQQLKELGEVSSLPKVMGVDIHVLVKDTDPKKFEEKKNKVKEIIKNSEFSHLVWSRENVEIEEVVLKLLDQRGLSLAVAESCTGGLIGSRLTDISGSSKSFLGSLVTYSNELKNSILKVQRTTLESYGAVSEETAIEMAKGAFEATGAQLTISTTGIAGPSGGSEKKPVGTICMALYDGKKVSTFRHELKGNRMTLKQRFSQMALYHLFDYLK